MQWRGKAYFSDARSVTSRQLYHLGQAILSPRNNAIRVLTVLSMRTESCSSHLETKSDSKVHAHIY